MQQAHRPLFGVIGYTLHDSAEQQLKEASPAAIYNGGQHQPDIRVVGKQSRGESQHQKPDKSKAMAKGNEGPNAILVHRTAEDQVGYNLGKEVQQCQPSHLLKGEGKLMHEGDIQQRSQITDQGPNKIAQITGSNGRFVHRGEYRSE